MRLLGEHGGVHGGLCCEGGGEVRHRGATEDADGEDRADAGLRGQPRLGGGSVSSYYEDVHREQLLRRGLLCPQRLPHEGGGSEDRLIRARRAAGVGGPRLGDRSHELSG